jgi:hypothetical protein
MRYFLVYIIRLGLVILGGIFTFPAYAAMSYIPGTTISMTGSNGMVFFDVADDIYNAIPLTSV